MFVEHTVRWVVEATGLRQLYPATPNCSANGTVNVLRTRPGVDGSQTFVTQVGRAGIRRPSRRLKTAAGQQVHYDPKGGTSIWKAIRDLFW